MRHLYIMESPVFFRWYYGKIKRMDAEKRLLSADNEHGSYLIRDSESRRNDFSLSGERASSVLVSLTAVCSCGVAMSWGRASHSTMIFTAVLV